MQPERLKLEQIEGDRYLNRKRLSEEEILKEELKKEIDKKANKEKPLPPSENN